MTSTIGNPACHDNATKLLDRLALERLRRFGGDTLLSQMIDLFVSTAPPRLDAAYAAASSRDCGGVQAALHALKSSAGQLGATSLQQLCEEGETLAAQHIGESLLPTVSAARETLVATIRLLYLVQPDRRDRHSAASGAVRMATEPGT